jgi:hypothetical protein
VIPTPAAIAPEPAPTAPAAQAALSSTATSPPAFPSAATLPAAGRITAQPKPTPMTGEALVQMNKAIDLCGSAAKSLGASNAAAANRDQRAVIAALELVLEKLQSDFEGFAQVAAGEFQQMVLAELERMIVIQKRCSLDTIDVSKKRDADGSFRRTEVLAMAALAKAEGDILPIMDHMLVLMATNKSAHSVVQFPPVVYLMLQMVRSDVQSVQRRLSENDPGDATRRVQKEIAERLEGIKAAMGSKGDSTTPPPQWGQNSLGAPESSKVDRIAEIQMMMVLQAQLNRRTQEFEFGKKSGKAKPDDIAREQRELSRLQADVRNFIERVIAEDQSAQDKSGRQ